MGTLAGQSRGTAMNWDEKCRQPSANAVGTSGLSKKCYRSPLAFGFIRPMSG
jgi:hypothetical protein